MGAGGPRFESWYPDKTRSINNPTIIDAFSFYPTTHIISLSKDEELFKKGEGEFPNSEGKYFNEWLLKYFDKDVTM